MFSKLKTSTKILIEFVRVLKILREYGEDLESIMFSTIHVKNKYFYERNVYSILDTEEIGLDKSKNKEEYIQKKIHERLVNIYDSVISSPLKN